MQPEIVALLTGLGVPVISAIAIVVIVWIFKESFSKLLDRAVANEAAKIKVRYDEILEFRKAELARETERLKIQLAVEAETHRLAAQLRFDQLIALWKASESLLRNTDLSQKESIQKSLRNVESCIEMIEANSVLYSPTLMNHLLLYVTELQKAFSKSIVELEKKSDSTVSFEKAAEGVAGLALPITPLASLISEMIKVARPFLDKAMVKIRLAAALQARKQLELALRDEFGVIHDIVSIPSEKVDQESKEVNDA